MQNKRKVEVVVLSDIHLGTRGCRSNELLSYLKTIQPQILILNGDIIDMWQFKKNYWPASHMKVIKHIIGLASKKTKVYYITGNHDEVLRRFAGFKIGNLNIVNQLVIELDGKTHWFFHGDVFDVIMKHSKWLAKAGAVGYDSLIWINTIVNTSRNWLGLGRVSLSKRIKDNVKSAVKHIHNFEITAAQLAASKGYQVIVCGHIHQPEIRKSVINNQVIDYLNSGDWIENMSALEYMDEKWTMYLHQEMFELTNEAHNADDEASLPIEDMKTKVLFQKLLEEFQT